MPAVASVRGVAVVTGASSGFGMYGSVELAKAGFRVYATMRSPDKRTRLDQEAAASGVAENLAVLPLDVDRDDSVAAAVGEVLSEAGRVDVLVANAGYGIGGLVEQLSMDEIRQQFETNFFGAVRVVKAVLPGMRERGSGRIILMSSLGVFNAVPGVSAYNATKAAMEAFGEALRYEVAPFGIFVSLIEPGTYRTDIFYDNRRMAAATDDPSAPLYEEGRRLEEFAMKQVARSKQDPRKVGVMIRKVATAPRPRLRYLAGIDTRPIKVLRAITPTRAVERVVARIMKP
jgi:NAD(P)-dependent dehydrogenase (short-subunit alcohol dehydrogenase family)